MKIWVLPRILSVLHTMLIPQNEYIILKEQNTFSYYFLRVLYSFLIVHPQRVNPVVLVPFLDHIKYAGKFLVTSYINIE